MTIANSVSLITILISLGLIAVPLAKKLHLPYTLVLILLGFIFSEIYTRLGFDTGIRAENFQPLIFFIFLPVLIFESAIHINFACFRDNIFTILSLAVFGMLITCLICAAGLFYGIAHESGFPWIAALLTGSLLAATDPVAVVSQLKQPGIPERLRVLLEGESLLNDATAIVLFNLFLTLALIPEEQQIIQFALQQFAKVFLGGIAVGLLIGGVSIILIRLISDHFCIHLLTLITAYSSFLIAEQGFHVSGITAVLVAGLLFAWGMQAYAVPSTQGLIHNMWEFIGQLGTLLVFLVMGITIYLDMFQERWLAMLIAIIAVLLARIISIYCTLSISNLFSRKLVPSLYKPILIWGGLRGAVTIALAFSIPIELDYWWTIQSIAFGVVLFSLFVQAPSCPLLISRAFPQRQEKQP